VTSILSDSNLVFLKIFSANHQVTMMFEFHLRCVTRWSLCICWFFWSYRFRRHGTL